MVLPPDLLLARGLVEDQPVQPELPDRLQKLGEVHGLADVAVRAVAVAVYEVLLLL